MRTRRGTRMAAMRAVLGDDDLLALILDAYAARLRGMCAQLLAARCVCKRWAAAVSGCAERLASWNEHIFHVQSIREMPAYGTLLRPTSSSGAYDWCLRVIPSVRRCQRCEIECGGLKAGCASIRDGSSSYEAEVDAQGRTWCKHGKLGLYLEVAEPLPGEHLETNQTASGQTTIFSICTDGEPWARRTECEIILHDMSAKSKQSVTKYFRHLFDRTSTDWGWGCGEEAFATSEELAAPSCPFIDANGGIKVTARVRVHHGHLLCSKTCIRHPLMRADGLQEYYKQGARFFCDLCGEEQSSASLHRCAAGCNFDVCTTCLTDEMTLV